MSAGGEHYKANEEGVWLLDQELSDTAKICKERLIKALTERITEFRYTEMHVADRSLIYDMAIAMHPAFCLKPYRWVRSVQDSEDECQKVENAIEEGILSRIEKVVSHYRSRNKDTGLVDSSAVQEANRGGAVPVLYHNHSHAFADFQSAAISAVATEIQKDIISTPAEEAKEWLKKFREWSVANAVHKKLNEMDHTGIFLYWANESTFPVLAEVARTLLGVQASAAQIERDFSIAGVLVNSRRSRLDCAYVDMVLFMYCSYDSIPCPEEVPKISITKFEDKLPRRYRDLDIFEDIRKIDNFRPEQDTADDDGRGDDFILDAFAEGRNADED